MQAVAFGVAAHVVVASHAAKHSVMALCKLHACTRKRPLCSGPVHALTPAFVACACRLSRQTGSCSSTYLCVLLLCASWLATWTLWVRTMASWGEPSVTLRVWRRAWQRGRVTTPQGGRHLCSWGQTCSDWVTAHSGSTRSVSRWVGSWWTWVCMLVLLRMSCRATVATAACSCALWLQPCNPVAVLRTLCSCQPFPVTSLARVLVACLNPPPFHLPTVHGECRSQPGCAA